jgi:electron transport complex protein RnfG
VSLGAAPVEGSPRAVYTVLVGIALMAGLAIALVFEFTAERVAAQRALLQNRAVQDVLPGAVRWQALAEDADGKLVAVEAGAATTRLFAGYDAAERRVGFAIPAQGMGYQDRIGLLFGVDPTTRRLLGLRVLESRETPGLGARVADDPAFLGSFRGLAIAFDELGRPRAPPFRRSPALGAGVDAISGATVSCQAVTRIVGAGLARWWPQLAQLEQTDG